MFQPFVESTPDNIVSTSRPQVMCTYYETALENELKNLKQIPLHSATFIEPFFCSDWICKLFISVYVDISDPDVECSTLAFNFKDQEMNRQWNITIIQIPCDYENRAPPGCLQYHFGVNENGVGGVIQSFNFDGGYHLADQDQEWLVFSVQALLYTSKLLD